MDDFNLFVLPLFLSSLRAYVSPSMISRSYCKRVGDFKGPYTGNILIFLEFIHVIEGKSIFNFSSKESASSVSYLLARLHVF